jgi:hypothetical protein
MHLSPGCVGYGDPAVGDAGGSGIKVRGEMVEAQGTRGWVAAVRLRAARYGGQPWPVGGSRAVACQQKLAHCSGERRLVEAPGVALGQQRFRNRREVAFIQSMRSGTATPVNVLSLSLAPGTVSGSRGSFSLPLRQGALGDTLRSPTRTRGSQCAHSCRACALGRRR